MQAEPVLPGLRPVALSNAVPLAASVSLTVPAVRVLPPLLVVAENAAYEDCQTTPALIRMPTGRTPFAMFLRTRLDGPCISMSPLDGADALRVSRPRKDRCRDTGTDGPIGPLLMARTA